VIAWESSWASLGFGWGMIGDLLGNGSAHPGNTQGGRWGNAGENLSAKSLDVGVSRKIGGRRC
jgi:hypothetical protein